MNKTARENIFARLHKASASGDSYVPAPSKWEPAPMEREARLEKFVELMTAVRSEVYRVKGDEWLTKMQEICKEREIDTMVYGADGPLGAKIDKAWKKTTAPTKLVPWKGEIEEFKDELFEVGAGVTSTIGGIAEAAALIVWPSPQEPRLMSLVPPVHFAVVEADKIYTSFPEAMGDLNWNENAPTNSLLISGPSKTADIELILQFGVHGPTDLIVFVVE